MLGALSVLFAILLPSGTGPIPQRIGAKLTYEAMVSIPSDMPMDSMVSFTMDKMDVQYSIDPIRVRKMRVDLDVVDSTSYEGMEWWTVTVRASGHPQPESLLLRHDSDGRWTWRSWSCLLPVDAMFQEAETPGYDIDRGGVLALNCSDKLFETAERSWIDRTSPSSVYGVHERNPMVADRKLTPFASSRDLQLGFRTYPLEPRKALHRDGVGWIRVEDRFAGVLLQLTAVDDVPIPRDWIPKMPYEVLSPEDSLRNLPVAGDLWMWKRVHGSESIRQGMVVPPDSLPPLDTLTLEVTHARDSAGWRVLRCRSEGGSEDPSTRVFGVRLRPDGRIDSDLDSFPSLFRNTLIRSRQCWDKDTCYVGTNFVEFKPGQSPGFNSWWMNDEGYHREIGRGVTFEGTRDRWVMIGGSVYFWRTRGWVLIHSPDNPPTTGSSIHSTPRRSSRSLVNLASENPQSRFSIATLDGSRHEWSGADLSRILPGLRGPVFWSARLDGTLRTGKHIRP